MRVLTQGAVEKFDLAPIALHFFQEQDLMNVIAREAVRCCDQHADKATLRHAIDPVRVV